jgi:hypothetical protein
MSPMRFELEGGPGSVHVGAMQITNDADHPIRMRAEILDFTFDETGTPQFQTEFPSEKTSSCRAWLTINPMELEIAPREKITARYSLRIPKEAEAREYHCAAGFTSLPTASETTRIGMRMAVRMISAFYIRAPGVKAEPELADISVERIQGGPKESWQLVALFRNKGLAHFRPKGDVTLYDEAGAELEKVSFTPHPVLPQRDQRFPLAINTPLNGKKVKFVARVDLDEGETHEATLRFDGVTAPVAPTPVQAAKSQ